MSCDGRRARSEKVRMRKSDVRRLDVRRGRLLMAGRGVEEIEKLKLGERDLRQAVAGKPSGLGPLNHQSQRDQT
ncbi:hypothetical protein Ddye_017068 [Dipteronia dyeriana]|uniref:Uncharacterized protein n=1 Tax=Dipteronia dyeriana TaxID=168575 RepID=A0AAD9U8V5_9ROSI|nr:hypothetical protein Ddye_017068 [Dipteronia dyeriana]